MLDVVTGKNHITGCPESFQTQEKIVALTANEHAGLPDSTVANYNTFD